MTQRFAETWQPWSARRALTWRRTAALGLFWSLILFDARAERAGVPIRVKRYVVRGDSERRVARRRRERVRSLARRRKRRRQATRDLIDVCSAMLC